MKIPLPALPKRPYKNIEDARTRAFAPYYTDQTFFPCLTCMGRGYTYRPEDRDVVEGYKLAPAYTCKTCNGKKSCTRKKFKKDYYDPAIYKWKDKVAKVKAIQHTIRYLNDNINPEHLAVLLENYHIKPKS